MCDCGTKYTSPVNLIIITATSVFQVLIVYQETMK